MAQHVDADNAHTRRIAEFVSSLTYERIPQAVRQRIKLLILDSLGCAIHGANLEWCRILRGALENVDATRTTSVWGTPVRLSSPHAALINGARIELSNKVKVVHYPAITALGSASRHKVRVDIRLRDGAIESETREAPRGSEQSFASPGEIVEKFSKLTRAAMTRKRQAALVDAVLNLEELADGKELTRLMRAGTRIGGGSDGARTRDLRRDRPGKLQ